MNKDKIKEVLEARRALLISKIKVFADRYQRESWNNALAHQAISIIDHAKLVDQFSSGVRLLSGVACEELRFAGEIAHLNKVVAELNQMIDLEGDPEFIRVRVLRLLHDTSKTAVANGRYRSSFCM